MGAPSTCALCTRDGAAVRVTSTSVNDVIGSAFAKRGFSSSIWTRGCTLHSAAPLTRGGARVLHGGAVIH
jgi:hypothetical protein